MVELCKIDLWGSQDNSLNFSYTCGFARALRDHFPSCCRVSVATGLVESQNSSATSSINPFFLGAFYSRTNKTYQTACGSWDFTRMVTFSLLRGKEPSLDFLSCFSFLCCRASLGLDQHPLVRLFACSPGLAPHSLASHPLSLALVWTCVIVCSLRGCVQHSQASPCSHCLFSLPPSSPILSHLPPLSFSPIQFA